MAGAILGLVPMVYESGRRLVEVDMKRAELNNVQKEVRGRMEYMDNIARTEERKPGKKRKNVLNAYFKQAEGYIVSAQKVLDGSQEGQWKVKRMKWVPSIERHHKEGQELVNKANQLLEEGLTYDGVRTHGEKLPLEENQYICETVRGLQDRAFKDMKEGNVKCIGIYGHAGAGKTNLMKHLYNKVFDDEEGFKAVFWATAPKFENDPRKYNQALQKCVADGMWVDLGNDVAHDEARTAGKLLAKLHEIGSDKPSVFFLDNVTHEFPAYELLGIPSQMNPENSDAKCILVFSTLSRDVCNRMQCDLTLKMDLLEKKEAEELFLYEVRNREINEHQLSNREERRIKQEAVKVANECARMPLAIIIIARSMVNIKELPEWKNRLNELTGTISSIHDEEDKILEQLRFGYDCLEDNTVQRCFLVAANMFAKDDQISKLNMIKEWKNRKLIGIDRPTKFVNDQGHTVLNQLERMCLIQVAPNSQILTMNKWIKKMANKVSQPVH
ncbi:hypothetical protein BVRB_7g168470 [Beta vulgaris subsp. vulgaris]|uniref:probable disease resistance protein At1g15890 n=1 Tax=Beta vulgaris subsp. vulgaris TaxID=3555 RepID=UPI00053F8800|nr:probable disease resistance protein At1g15890 [Beta vulgaris subsp. vulgaris]XP_010685135.1 probable disease resistance protein At1g15890 [Beta vulgaris subsp. vulgaris]XP_048503826.1 probable disease resistance protein At1g15890 [Beta vulgaris subsp. vulgaris]XP_048503827.1 probable disease resistance protein At1g15890 [Beta vulgaris subsp. vulgaris]XP_048503828.1 probable disease resistance protein At1g15890 [Beta vulgaris subsp. vulgaris]KMT04664.1 hypothetical protein BVRB_7g168470 [Bet